METRDPSSSGTWLARPGECRAAVGGFSPDGRLVIVTSTAASSVIGLVEGSRPAASWPGSERPDLQPMNWFRFSSDGSRLLAVVNEPPSVQVIDLRPIPPPARGDGPRLGRAGLLRRRPRPRRPAAFAAARGRLRYSGRPPRTLLGAAGGAGRPVHRADRAEPRRRRRLPPSGPCPGGSRNRAAQGCSKTLSRAIRLRPGDVHLLHTRARFQASSSSRGTSPRSPTSNRAAQARPVAVVGPRAPGHLLQTTSPGIWPRSPGSSPDAARALTLSARAVELAPGQQTYLNTRGVALYLAGQFAAAGRWSWRRASRPAMASSTPSTSTSWPWPSSSPRSARAARAAPP